MRAHLRKCFEKNLIIPFPKAMINRNKIKESARQRIKSTTYSKPQNKELATDWNEEMFDLDRQIQVFEAKLMEYPSKM